MANRHIKQSFRDSDRLFKIGISHDETNFAELGNAEMIRTDFEAQIHTGADYLEFNLSQYSFYESGATRTKHLFMTLHGDEVAALRDLLKLMDGNLKLKAQT